MHFAQPIWLFVSSTVLVLLPVLYVLAERERSRRVTRFAAVAGLMPSVSRTRRVAKAALVTLGLAAVSLALARPQWGAMQEQKEEHGVDLVFAIDTSKSMLAEDAHPNRLARAKLSVEDLVNHFAGNRVGLVAFAGGAYVACPLTFDHAAFEEALAAVNTKSVPRGGTNIAEALRTGADAFASGEKSQKLLVLLTDGEDLQGDAQAAAKDVASAGVRVFTVGVGSPNGELIPIATKNGGQEFLRDAQGTFVKSHLDEAALKEIATTTNGAYRPLGQNGQGLESLYREELAPLAGTIGSHTLTFHKERFEWPLALALVCLALEVLIDERKRRVRTVEAPTVAKTVAKKVAKTAIAASFLGVAFMPHLAHASERTAAKAYEKKDYAAAKKDYVAAADKSPERLDLRFDAGAANYRAGDYADATGDFQKALASDDVGLQTQAYYDLGNTQYRTGEATLEKDKPATIDAWKHAVESYKGALALNGKDQDAAYNLDFVTKRLAKLEEEQKQQQQNQKNDQKKDQKQSASSGGDDKKDGGKGNDGKKDDQQKSADAKSGGDQKSDQQKNAQQKPGDDKSQAQKAADDKAAQQAAADQKNAADREAADQKDAGDKDGQANGEKPSADQPGQPPTRPGELSPQQARAMLKALKGDQHSWIPAPDQRGGAPAPEDAPGKDW